MVHTTCTIVYTHYLLIINGIATPSAECRQFYHFHFSRQRAAQHPAHSITVGSGHTT